MFGAPSEDTSSSRPKTSMPRSRLLRGSRRLVLAARSRYAQPRSTGSGLVDVSLCSDVRAVALYLGTRTTIARVHTMALSMGMYQHDTMLRREQHRVLHNEKAS